MIFNKLGTKPGEFDLVEVGESFGPLCYPVDDHAVKTFAFTQDDYNPWYFSDENPFAKRICPSAILANDLLRLFLTEYDPCKIEGLHTSEELWFCNPLYVGDTVTLHGQYVDKYVRRGKGYVTMEAEAKNSDGITILKHRGTEIMKIHGSALDDKKKANIVGDVVTGEYDTSLPFVSHADSSLAEGMPLTPLVKHTTPEQTQVFSGIGMHFINMHNTLQAAKNAGYSNLVVQGQQQVCYIAELLTNFFGADWFTSGHLKTKMIKPVLVGDTLTFMGTIKAIEIIDGKTKVSLHVWSRNKNNEMTIIGWADALLSR